MSAPVDPADLEPPHRRLRLHLEVDGDSIEDLCRRLRQVETDLYVDGEKTTQRVSGGHIMRLEIDREQTPERFEQQLTEWMDARKAAREEADHA